MELISVQHRGHLLNGARDVLKVELRDEYAADAETFEAWRSGGFPTIEEAARAWADKVAADLTAGRTWRRVRVISEPWSDYQRYAYEFVAPAVDAGEDLRYLSRRLASVLPLPGNDCFVLDGELAVFNVLSGDGDRVEIQMYRDAEAVKFCRDTIEAAYSMAARYRDYQP